MCNTHCTEVGYCREGRRVGRGGGRVGEGIGDADERMCNTHCTEVGYGREGACVCRVCFCV